MILTSEIFKIPRFDFYQSITSNSNLLSRKDLINSNFNLNVFDYERIKRHEFRYHPYHKIIAEKINFLDDDGELIKSLIRGVSDNSKETILKQINTLRLCFDTDLHIKDKTYNSLYTYIDPCSLFEDLQYRFIIDYIHKNTKKINNDAWQFKNYKLPFNGFDIDVFYYRYNVDLIDNKDYVKGKSIIDAGAYIGDTALVLSEDYPCKNVYSFEPEPNNFKYLEQTILLNNKDNIIPVQYGLGDKNETLKFNSLGGQSGSGTFVTVDSDVLDNLSIKYKEKIEVKIVKLDDFVKEHNLTVGLIKTDLEGYEQNFLEGAKQTIKIQRPILILSIYHTFDDFFKIKVWLESLQLNYKFKFCKTLNGCVFTETKLIAIPL